MSNIKKNTEKKNGAMENVSAADMQWMTEDKGDISRQADSQGR